MTKFEDVTKLPLNKEQKYSLQNLLEFLKDNNEYYQTVFQERNINIYDEIDQSFYSLPICEKGDIRNNYKRYISHSTDQYYSEKTSGSTGIPLVCLKTRKERLIASLNVWDRRREWDSRVNLYNFMPLHDTNTYKAIGNFFEFDPSNMAQCFSKIGEISPRWLSGPASAIEKYCRLIQLGQIKYHKNFIQFIELAGEYADREQRNFIESVLQCKTINHYGTIETWCIAYECTKGKLHVQDTLFFVEEAIPKIKPPGNDNAGEIVVTSFYNKLMPIVRYNLKDIGRVEHVNCECGKASQVIDLKGGRSGDVIVGEKKMMGEVFFKRGIYKLINRGYDCIEGFKVEQVELKRFIFYIVKGHNFSENVIGILKDYIKGALGKDIIIDFIFVGSIPSLPSGKTKIFHSFIQREEIQ